MAYSLENALNPDDSEASYRVLRDAILQIYQFGTKIAKEANPDYELQISWELGDTSLMNWISETYCYLSIKGHKMQFLSRPSKLEIISFKLEEGDKLLIFSDSLRQNLSNNEIDEILQESHGSENSCQNLLKMANVNYGENINIHNIVVMEVINNAKGISPAILTDDKKPSLKTSKFNSIWIFLLILLLVIGAGFFWLWKNNLININDKISGNNAKINWEDTKKFINQDSLKLAKAENIAKEFESKQISTISPEQKDDSGDVSTKVLINESNSSNSNVTDKSLPENTSPKINAKANHVVSGSKKSRTKIFDQAAEEQNYNALIQQKERWTTIKNELQNIFDSGNTAAAEKLKNSKKVLERIEKKLRESGRKLGKN